MPDPATTRTGRQVLRYGPAGTQNPYFGLLYAECARFGLLPEAMSFDEVRRLDEAEWPARSVFHLHWTRFAQVDAADESQARDGCDRFLAQLDHTLASGATLVYSVHERLPHECPYPGVEAGFRQALVDRAAVVHVLHEATPEVCADLFTIPPEKVLTVPHPLYVGAYPDDTSRDEARRALGITDDDVVLLCFGAIRPYKGVDRMLAAQRALHRAGHHEVRLIIAGPRRPGIVDDPRSWETAAPRVSVRPRFVADDEIQILFRAADLAVLPYAGEFINSGVAFLALGFDTPVLVSDNEAMRSLRASGLVTTFTNDGDDALRDALVDWLHRPRESVELDAAFRRHHHPTAVSEAFARGLRARLDGVEP